MSNVKSRSWATLRQVALKKEVRQHCQGRPTANQTNDDESLLHQLYEDNGDGYESEYGPIESSVLTASVSEGVRNLSSMFGFNMY